VSVTTTQPDGRAWNLGAFIPTKVTPDRLEGVVYEPVGGCVAGSCSTQGLNLYKASRTARLGEGGRPQRARYRPPRHPVWLAQSTMASHPFHGAQSRARLRMLSRQARDLGRRMCSTDRSD
jgi:hypothetical protein